MCARLLSSKLSFRMSLLQSNLAHMVYRGMLFEVYFGSLRIRFPSSPWNNSNLERRVEFSSHESYIKCSCSYLFLMSAVRVLACSLSPFSTSTPCSPVVGCWASGVACHNLLESQHNSMYNIVAHLRTDGIPGYVITPFPARPQCSSVIVLYAVINVRSPLPVRI